MYVLFILLTTLVCAGLSARHAATGASYVCTSAQDVNTQGAELHTYVRRPTFVANLREGLSLHAALSVILPICFASHGAHLFFPSCSTYVLPSTRFTATLRFDGPAGVLTTPRSCFLSVLRADLEALPSSQHRFLDCDLCTPSSRSSASKPGSKNDSAGRMGSPPLPSLSFRLN